MFGLITIIYRHLIHQKSMLGSSLAPWPFGEKIRNLKKKCQWYNYSWEIWKSYLKKDSHEPRGRLCQVMNERASSPHFARSLTRCLRTQGHLELSQTHKVTWNSANQLKLSEIFYIYLVPNCIIGNLFLEMNLPMVDFWILRQNYSMFTVIFFGRV